MATGRIVAITGVSRGLGEALAVALARAGQTVVGCARSAERIARLQDRFGPPHDFTPLSVTDEPAVAAWAADLAARDLLPDILVNNAAVAHRKAVLWKVPADEFNQVVQVNLLGVANVLRHFVPRLLVARKGILVNVSSGWGRDAAAWVSGYCAAKWGLEGMTKSLARELPPFMAAVSVHPGVVNTDMLRNTFGKQAEQFPSPEQWADAAAEFLLGLGPEHNGQSLSVPVPGQEALRGEI